LTELENEYEDLKRELAEAKSQHVDGVETLTQSVKDIEALIEQINQG
jgi:hypothetical protein